MQEKKRQVYRFIDLFESALHSNPGVSPLQVLEDVIDFSIPASTKSYMEEKCLVTGKPKRHYSYAQLEQALEKYMESK